MPQATIPFPWYLLVQEDDGPLVVTGNLGDMVLIFTDVEFALLYNQRNGSECQIQKVSDPSDMIEFFEQLTTFLDQLIDARTLEESDHIRLAAFDPIEPSGESGVSAFKIQSLLSGLRTVGKLADRRLVIPRDYVVQTSPTSC